MATPVYEKGPQNLADAIREVDKLHAAQHLTATLLPSSTVNVMSSDDNKCFQCQESGHMACHFPIYNVSIVMNTAMSPQTAQTKFHHQEHLHNTEIIILAWDTILDPHLTIITGTDTGLTGQDHTPAVTGTEVTARVIHREVTPGHITDIHTEAHLATDTQTLIIINWTHQIGDIHCTEALLHILEIAVGLSLVLCTKLLILHLLNPPTALTGQSGNTSI